MDHLLDITICHSLSFNIEENISSVLNVIPNNAFGVFVTVHRTDLPNNKDYNNNVHGCIGNWTNNINDINQNIARFDVMNKNNIIESIKMVSYKATWEDNRKNYFDTIYKDSYSDYEITFLLNNPPPRCIEHLVVHTYTPPPLVNGSTRMYVTFT